MSSPSGTDKIMAFLAAPVSNSAGHTRFPTFSRMARSMSPVSNPFSPCLVIPASRWHMPPVWSWSTFTPVPWIILASTSESMSASMTPILKVPFNASMVFIRVVVLPAPGEDIRFKRKTPFSFSSARSSPACRSLSAKTLCLISKILTSFMKYLSFHL